ncbi:hypothetical protein LCGC14_0483650 [marine sediment metagenome]|uniref:Uncharacterized protein n=1 Tax=marine sediment metagenome TaxID=412755 RepID=A0A0F9SDU6_9ZZZZ
MSKLAIETERSIRKAIKIGQKGKMFKLLDSKGNVLEEFWTRSCYCLSKGLFRKPTKCPTHRRLITQ